MNYKSPEEQRKALQEFMDKHNLRAYNWAKKANVSGGTLRNFLKGNTNSLTLKTLHKLANAANVTVAEMLGENYLISTISNFNDHNSFQNIGGLQNMKIPHNPCDVTLDKISNPCKDSRYNIKFKFSDFSFVDLLSGQPSSALITIDYIPDEFIMENNSLKIYLTAFRNSQLLHEGCIIDISQRIINEIHPEWLKVVGSCIPNYGMPVEITYDTGLQSTLKSKNVEANRSLETEGAF